MNLENHAILCLDVGFDGTLFGKMVIEKLIQLWTKKSFIIE